LSVEDIFNLCLNNRWATQITYLPHKETPHFIFKVKDEKLHRDTRLIKATTLEDMYIYYLELEEKWQ